MVMDICTLTIVSTMNLLGCLAPKICDDHDGKRYCQPQKMITCQMPTTYWLCTKDDGSTYIEPFKNPVDSNGLVPVPNGPPESIR
jgi:hypothetical protein